MRKILPLAAFLSLIVISILFIFVIFTKVMPHDEGLNLNQHSNKFVIVNADQFIVSHTDEQKGPIFISEGRDEKEDESQISKTMFDTSASYSLERTRSELTSYNRNRRSSDTRASVIVRSREDTIDETILQGYTDIIIEKELDKLDEEQYDDDVILFPNYEYHLLEIVFSPHNVNEIHSGYGINYDSSESLDLSQTTSFTGYGIRVAVLDTGVNLENTVAQKSFFEDDTTEDKHGHGTQVASVVQNNAPDVEFISAKVLDDTGRGTSHSIGSGILWATTQSADIIVLSVGSPYITHDRYIEDAIEKAIDAGVIVVIAAGNCQQGCNNYYDVTYPGLIRDVITVGSSNENDISYFSSFSDFGNYYKPEVLARGENIPALNHNLQETTFTGTSASAPFVASIAAHIREHNESAYHFDIKDSLMKYGISLEKNGLEFSIIDETFLDRKSGVSSDSNVTEIITDNETQTNISDTTPINETIIFNETISSNETTQLDLNETTEACESDGCEQHISSQSICGDGRCDPGEYCAQDCVEIIGLQNVPTWITEGHLAQVDVVIKNRGTVAQVGSLELGIVPQSWQGITYPQSTQFETQSVVYAVSRCCAGNEFYSQRLIYEIDPGTEMTILNVEMYAPSQNSFDSCGSLSAWDSSFYMIAGLFDGCGQGYHDFTKRTVYVDEAECSVNSDCPASYNSDTYCRFGDVYYTRTTYTCSSGSCVANDQEIRDRQCNYDCEFGECISPPDTCDGQPDGSSWSCSCSTDSDCYSGYYCRHVSGPNRCEPIIHTNECNQVGYSCDGNNVVQCYDAGSHLRQRTVDVCGRHDFCDIHSVAATGSCTSLPSHLEVWIDFAQPLVKVNKMHGDTFTLNYYLEKPATIELTYDTDTFYGDCVIGMRQVAAGTHSCTLTVKDNAEFRRHHISLGTQSATVEVIRSPRTVYVTHSEKLRERYKSQETGVKAVLARTYEMAEHGGYVLDLKVVPNHPFPSFHAYNERTNSLSFSPNEYVLESARLLQEKCINCDHVTIVGDDFVVPRFRRDILHLENRLFRQNEYFTRDIASDTPYIAKRMLEFSNHHEMFLIDGEYAGKKVVIIEPENPTTEQRAAIEKLKDTYDAQGYNPRFTHMNGKETACFDNTWFNDLKGSSLIIIGDETNNNAFKCMPFVSGDMHEDSIFIQPNPWDSDEYAVVINTNNPLVIETFALLIETGEIEKMRTYGAYLFSVGTEYVGYLAIGVGITALTVGTGGGAAVALGATAITMNLVADAAYISNDCVVNYDGMGACAFSAGMGAMVFANSAQVRASWHNSRAVWNSLTPQKRNTITTIYNSYATDAALKGPEYARNFRVAMSRNNPLDIEAAHHALSLNSLNDIRAYSVGNLNANQLADGLGDIGYLRNIGVDLGSPSIPSSFAAKIKSVENVGLFGQAKYAANYAQRGRGQIIMFEGNLNSVIPHLDGDVVVREGADIIVTQVKNVRRLSMNELSQGSKLSNQLSRLSQAPGKQLPNNAGQITRSRLAISDHTVLDPGVENYIRTTYNLEIERFAGVVR